MHERVPRGCSGPSTLTFSQFDPRCPPSWQWVSERLAKLKGCCYAWACHRQSTEGTRCVFSSTQVLMSPSLRAFRCCSAVVSLWHFFFLICVCMCVCSFVSAGEFPCGACTPTQHFFMFIFCALLSLSLSLWSRRFFRTFITYRTCV